ncbi:MAG: DUF2341 domain-containing protein [Fibrobacter sp.]|jgi:hypothetical protein|nr:DUF2341 domain-containing protein [Fibrobacter sp.]
MKSAVAIILAVLSISLITVCNSPDTAGATTETTNGIAGCIRNKDNTVAANTIVKLFVHDYNPMADTSEYAILIDTTDIDGNFSFRRIRSGNYSVLARNEKQGTSAMLRDITVPEDSINEIPSFSLDKNGSILVQFHSLSIMDSGSYLYIPGTDIVAVIKKADDSILLSEIPSGSFKELILIRSENKRTNILRNELEIRPDTTINIEKPLWKFSRQIILNTTSSGADIKGDIRNFPVLIRLNAANFDFSQAMPGGKDLLFSAKNKSILPYQIERWDENSGQAEVWVKIDTIFGNAEQSIIMYWGNPEATLQKTDQVVFDTADGFQCVWHLGENADSVYDATANGYHGYRFGNISRAFGIIGFAQRFDSSGAYCDMGNVFNPANSDFTISAWAKRADTGLQAIIVKSNGDKPNDTYGWNLSFGLSNQLHFFTATAGTTWAEAGSFDLWSDLNSPIIDSTSWHHVAVVISRSDNERCRCYIDGVDVTGGYRGNISEITSIFNKLPLRIGSEADGDYKLTGSIDECVISNVARSEEWIRLCFINQGPDDRLVSFK